MKLENRLEFMQSTLGGAVHLAEAAVNDGRMPDPLASMSATFCV